MVNVGGLLDTRRDVVSLGRVRVESAALALVAVVLRIAFANTAHYFATLVAVIAHARLLLFLFTITIADCVHVDHYSLA